MSQRDNGTPVPGPRIGEGLPGVCGFGMKDLICVKGREFPLAPSEGYQYGWDLEEGDFDLTVRLVRPGSPAKRPLVRVGSAMLTVGESYITEDIHVDPQGTYGPLELGATWTLEDTSFRLLRGSGKTSLSGPQSASLSPAEPKAG